MSELTLPPVEELELHADSFDLDRAEAIYREHGCLVVRGLMKPYIEAIKADIERTAQESIELLDQAEERTEGWVTPNGTLFIPAPDNFERDKQLMVLSVSYYTSAAFRQSAFDPKVVQFANRILGENVELQDKGQCLYKEPVGGHPKNLHQDSAYFEHKYEGPLAMLNYAVDTDLVNGALHVVPGSHRLGQLEHVDTFSHLGLDLDEWPWEKALPICGEAGDSIFFHVKTIHGSKENHSQAARPVFIHRYRRTDDYTIVGATTVENRAEAEAKAAEKTVKPPSEYGLMVSGYRQYRY
jgi:ectoine hydroxylase-related dioxygenase (phytanoyl-CoA dioxygenase family)